jgi:hypothetical protein
MIPAPPIRRAYWVLPCRFLAGAYPSSSLQSEAEKRAEAIAADGVTLSVSLMFPTERDNHGNEFRPYSAALVAAAAARGRACRCVRFPIVDGGVPSPELMGQILDAIDGELAVGGSVYLHCWGGRGRTGTVVACWLIRHAIATPAAAVDHLQLLVAPAADWFRPTPENELQRQFVAAWTAGR